MKITATTISLDNLQTRTVSGVVRNKEEEVFICDGNTYPYMSDLIEALCETNDLVMITHYSNDGQIQHSIHHKTHWTEMATVTKWNDSPYIQDLSCSYGSGGSNAGLDSEILKAKAAALSVAADLAAEYEKDL